ncbi:peptidoglycan-binding protein [Coleofasciculus sp. FACHB-T130]|uniref:peptidoglycan-binding domain-containing protein n=1 Tax=Cyanophyceae TaxID=3028117 RepID=UPI001687C583|nr:peptidoglycan-binding protein [Coleofasciculus sp. FACHB-T130]MBD1881993.1 peptidoglycan-binding protein [Coleofasciculus sp. FACHB-T130]
MWNRFGMPLAAVITITASLVSYQVAIAERSRDYTPREFRSLLRGFGYNVTVGDTLTDEATIRAIREFQQGYKLTPVDATAGPKTQDYAANIVRILQANLNLAVKPNPPLPRNQFYGPRTEDAIRQFQRQFNLPVTGIATLPVRQRLDQEARRILGFEQQSPAPATTPTPQSAPEPTLAPSPSPSPAPTPRATPTPSPSPSPSPRPAPSPSPSPRPTSSPSPSPAPSPSPSPSS